MQPLHILRRGEPQSLAGLVAIDENRCSAQRLVVKSLGVHVPQFLGKLNCDLRQLAVAQRYFHIRNGIL